jgi:drug/metabolite transporter (DMT)-like permease
MAPGAPAPAAAIAAAHRRLSSTVRGRLEALLAAFVFATSVPVTKVLLGDIRPLALSAVIYLAAGAFSLLLVLASRGGHASADSRRDLVPGDWPWLAGGVAAGSVLAPLALLGGMQRTSGHAAGLLLNFEVVFTVGLGIVFAGERLGRRGGLGGAAIWLGALLVSWPGAEPATTSGAHWTGALLILGACALWGLDNNLTLRISGKDATQIVAVKGLVGGAVSLVLALALGQTGGWTPARLAAAAAVGALTYGLTIVLFVRCMRTLGVVQTGLFFAMAPGMAAVLAWVFLREPAGLAGLTALGVMTAGALLLATDPHVHAPAAAPSCQPPPPGA